MNEMPPVNDLDSQVSASQAASAVPYGYIYITSNWVNGKKYVGQKRGPEFIPEYLGSGVNIKLAVKKHGRNVFTVTVLSWAYSREDLNSLEKKLISEYRQNFGRRMLYNCAEGGQGAGYHTPETKKKISARGKGRPSWNKGRSVPPEVREKIRAKLVGRPLSAEHRKRLREGQAKHYALPESREKRRLECTGRVHKDATKIKMSLSRKAYWDKKPFSEQQRLSSRASFYTWKLAKAEMNQDAQRIEFFRAKLAEAEAQISVVAAQSK